jgi:hypothetical protein
MAHTRPAIGRMARFLIGHAFLRKHCAIVPQSRNPPRGHVSCRLCEEDDETANHIIYDFGHFVQHMLDTKGVHQMHMTNPEWDVKTMFKFL